MENSTPPPRHPPITDRDSRGRFRTGNIGGPGRRSKQNVFNGIWDKEFKTDHFKKMIWKLYDMALKGDIKAMTYFLDRCMGKIKDVQEVTLTTNEVRNPEDLRQEFIALVNASTKPSNN